MIARFDGRQGVEYEVRLDLFREYSHLQTFVLQFISFGSRRFFCRLQKEHEIKAKIAEDANPEVGGRESRDIGGKPVVIEYVGGMHPCA